MLPLLLPFLDAPAPQAPPKPKVPEAVVSVQDRSIQIPKLPKDVGHGREAFKSIHSQIQVAQEDLVAALQALYARPEGAVELGEGPGHPKVEVKDGSEWMDLLTDPQYGQLRFTFLEVWKGWQAALMESRLANPVQEAPAKNEVHSPGYEATRRKALRVIAAPSRRTGKATGQLEASYNEENAELFSDGTEPMTYDAARGGRLIERSRHIAQTARAVAEAVIPDLTEAWNPLVDHLNGQVRRLGEMEAAAVPAGDPNLQALRVRTKIAVLERFRATLWFCDLVWSQLAAAEPPAPPRRLGPPSSR